MTLGLGSLSNKRGGKSHPASIHEKRSFLWNILGGEGGNHCERKAEGGEEGLPKRGGSFQQRDNRPSGLEHREEPVARSLRRKRNDNTKLSDRIPP